MAENEIQILIKAVDEATATLKKVESSVKSMSKETVKQTQSASQAFSQMQGSILILGQAASSVDRIFDSYQNLQLRLENASLRVYEAQKNQRDAQYNLNKVMQDSEATAEDLAKAQDDLDTATNRVTMAQNNQARANNAVIGTYIGISMQVVTLIASIPTLITSVVTMATAFWGWVTATVAETSAMVALGIAGLPVWLVCLAILAVVALLITIFLKWKELLLGLAMVLTWVGNQAILAWERVKDSLEVIMAGIHNIFAIGWNSIIDMLQAVVNTAIKGINALINAYNKIPFVKKISTIPNIDLSQWKAEIIDIGALMEKQKKDREKTAAELEKARWDAIGMLQDKINYKTPEQKAIEDQQKLQEEIGKTNGAQSELNDTVKKLAGYKVQYTRDAVTGKVTYGDVYKPGNFASNEFESEYAYQQAKLGAGTTINIENLSGINATEISQALVKELGKKISL